MANNERRTGNEGQGSFRSPNNPKLTESEWNKAVGPFYTTAGVAKRLQLTEEAVWQQVQEKRLLAMFTNDEVLVFPQFQFTQAEDGKTPVVIPGFSAILRTFDYNSVDGWTLSAWLKAEQPDLGGKSVVDYLKETKNIPRALTLAREQAWRYEQ